MTEDEIIAQIKALEACPDEQISAMLCASITDDLVDFEPPSSSANEQSEGAADTDTSTETSSSENKSDSNNTSSSTPSPTATENKASVSADEATPILSMQDPKEVKNKMDYKFYEKVFNMLYEKYGGKDLVKLEGEPEKKEDEHTFLSWLPMAVAITFGLIFLILHILAFYNKPENTNALEVMEQPMSSPRPKAKVGKFAKKKMFYGSTGGGNDFGDDDL